MLKSKAVITRWAKEVVRCEQVLTGDNSSDLEKRQAEWKIEAIMLLFEKDFEAIMLLIKEIEEIFQKDLTK